MSERSSLEDARFACPRCGSDEWSYCDYGGCSGCRPYEARETEDEDDKVASWVAWALTTPLGNGFTSFGRAA